MSARHHLPDRTPCPLLPPVSGLLTAETTRQFRGNYGPEFYLAALRYAQSLWLEGKPAQSLLQMNKAFLAELAGEEEILLEWPLPYAAKRWVLENCPGGEFLGNPVRHYQHLATRMSGPRAELRTWRAWACFHLARAALPGADYPPDERQLEREAIVLPEWSEVLARLEALGLRGEAELVRTAVEAWSFTRIQGG